MNSVVGGVRSTKGLAILCLLLVTVVIVTGNMIGSIDLVKEEFEKLKQLNQLQKRDLQEDDGTPLPSIPSPVVLFVLPKFQNDDNDDISLTETFASQWAKRIKDDLDVEVKSVAVSARKVSVTIPADHADQTDQVIKLLSSLPNVEYVERKMDYSLL